MKKLKYLVVLLLAVGMAQQSKSQVLIGLLFGEKLNKGPIEFGLDIIGNYSTTSISNNSDYRRKLGFGLYLDYKISDRFVLSSSFFFSAPKGEINFDESDPLFNLTDSLFIGATTERKLNYFELPVVFNYRPVQRIGIGLGGYIAMLMSATDAYSSSVTDGDISYERSILADMNRIDYGLVAAAHYHFKGEPGSQIHFKYMYGMANLLKDGSKGNGYNETFQIGVMIPIKFGVLPSGEAPVEE